MSSANSNNNSNNASSPHHTADAALAAAASASTLHVPNVTNASDAADMIRRVQDVAGDDCELSERILIPSKFKNIRDQQKLRLEIEKEFNKNWGPPEQDPRPIVNAGARSGTRVPPGHFFLAQRNNKVELRIGSGDRLTTQIVAGYTDVGVLGGNEGVVSELEPVIGGSGSFVINVPPGKMGKVYVGVRPLLLGPGPHVIHDPTLRVDRSSFLVEIGVSLLEHGTLRVLRVPPAKLAKITINSTPLLVPHRPEPFVFDTPLFSFSGLVDENSTYIEHSPIHVVRVLAGSCACVWVGSTPMLLEHRRQSYFFSEPAFRAAQPLFVSANQKLIQHGSISRIRPGVDGDREKAVILSDGELQFVDRFQIIESVTDTILGFVNTGIQTLVFPSEATRRQRKQQNPQATSDELNYETVSTSDSLKVGIKLVVAFVVEDPSVCLARLKLSEIASHVENLASSDLTRAVQSSTSSTFVNSMGSHKDDENANANPFGGGSSVAEKVRKELSEHLAECGIKLLRFSVEEMKVLDEAIRVELSKSSLVAASANAEQAVLSQQAQIARSRAEVTAMSKRVEQEQQNEIMVSQARAALEASKLRAQSVVVDAEAKSKAAEFEGQLYQKYPELLQLRMAEMQFAAIGKSQMTVVSETLASSPYALGAGLGAVGAYPLGAQQQQQQQGGAAKK